MSAKAWTSPPNGCAVLLLLSTALTTGVVGVASAQTPGSNTPGTARAVARASYNFSISSQPLAGAISAFSRITGLDVVGDGGIGRGIQSPGVSGNLTPQQALARLLAGTGLSYRFTNASTVAIQRPNADGSVGALPAGAIPLDTIDVQGETAWGPVDGFVASRSLTGTKTDTPLIEVPQAISVITRDQIETQRPTSLNDALSYSPGLFAEANGLQPGAARYFMRGFQGNEGNGSFYLNGLQTVGAHTGVQIETYGLERIEVMRGPSSVLYGQGQPAGLVNLVTKRPTEQTIHEVQLQGGSFDYKQGAFDFSGAANEDKTLLYRLTGLVRDAKTQIDFSRDDRVFISGAVTWRPTDATNITLYSLYQKNNYNWNYGVPAWGSALPNPNGRIPNTRFVGEPAYTGSRSEQALIGYSLEHQLTDNFKFRQNFQYGRANVSEVGLLPMGLGADLRTMNRSYYPVQDARDNIAIDNQAEFKAYTGPLKHTILLGLNSNRRTIDNRTGWGAAPPIDIFNPVYGQPLNPPALGSNNDVAQTVWQTGLYLQDQIKLDQWILTLGGRYDWATLDTLNRNTVTKENQRDQAFTKRVGLGYEFDIGLVPYLSYSESFLPLSGVTFDGTPFSPETGTQYEAGIKYQPVGTNMRFAAAIYDLRRQNVLTVDPAHPGRSIQTGEVTSRGLELEAVASLTSNLNLTATYTYNDVKVTESNNADLGKRPARTPPHVSSLWADYTIREGTLNGLGFGGGIRYVSASVGDYLNTFEAPAYTLVDAMIRYEVDQWRFAINASNVFDKYYVAACFSLAQCNLGRGRTVLGTVTYRW